MSQYLMERHFMALFLKLRLMSPHDFAFFLLKNCVTFKQPWCMHTFYFCNNFYVSVTKVRVLRLFVNNNGQMYLY